MKFMTKLETIIMNRTGCNRETANLVANDILKECDAYDWADKKHLDLSVAKLSIDADFKRLHGHIESYEDANLLAQLEMSRKSQRGEYYNLIVIFPGWNVGIENKPDLYKKALELEEKYKEELK